MNYGYPKIHPDYWISINQFLDIQKSVEYGISIILFLDIQKSNYGYHKIQSLQSKKNTSLNTLKSSQFLDILKSELWISKNRIMDILNSAGFWISKSGFLDILKYTDFWISKNELWISKNRIIDILNSV